MNVLELILIIIFGLFFILIFTMIYSPILHDVVLGGLQIVFSSRKNHILVKDFEFLANIGNFTRVSALLLSWLFGTLCFLPFKEGNPLHNTLNVLGCNIMLGQMLLLFITILTLVAFGFSLLQPVFFFLSLTSILPISWISKLLGKEAISKYFSFSDKTKKISDAKVIITTVHSNFAPSLLDLYKKHALIRAFYTLLTLISLLTKLIISSIRPVLLLISLIFVWRVFSHFDSNFDYDTLLKLGSSFRIEVQSYIMAIFDAIYSPNEPIVDSGIKTGNKINIPFNFLIPTSFVSALKYSGITGSGSISLASLTTFICLFAGFTSSGVLVSTSSFIFNLIINGDIDLPQFKLFLKDKFYKFTSPTYRWLTNTENHREYKLFFKDQFYKFTSATYRWLTKTEKHREYKYSLDSLEWIKT